jgi:hypothetical protein
MLKMPARNNLFPDTGSVLGVDIGFSESRRSSAVCRLDWNSTTIVLSIERFRALAPERSDVLRRITCRPLLTCALDGPIRSDLEIIGSYRVAERLLTRKLQPFIGKPGQASAPVGKALNHHTNLCAKIILETGLVRNSAHDHPIHKSAIVEAFPSSFLGLLIENPKSLGVQRGNRSDRFYLDLVRSGGFSKLAEHLLPGRRFVTDMASIGNHDDRAAVVCALTALCVAVGEYTAVGDGDGWIILPPRDLIAAWAWPLLCENARSGGLEWRSRAGRCGRISN